MIEPGARLAGRYRLDELVSESEGASFWKATDETLARLVGVRTFADGFPRTAEAVRAARATSRIADSRVTQVFDADDSGPTPYVVEEWVVGQSLTDLLKQQGPLDPERAAGLIAEAAETLATANGTGLYHLNLTPDKLIWSVGGAVKLTGIGVDAALHGIAADDATVADARGLGRLLYAGLTARWPGPPGVDLPAAPAGPEGAPLRPSQVRPGVPARFDELALRAAFQAPLGPGPAPSAQHVAEALADVPRLVPIPVSPAHAPAAPPPERGTSRNSGQFPASAAGTEAGGRTGRRQAAAAARADRTRTLRKAGMGAAAVAVFIAVVVGAWNIGSSLNTPATEGTETGSGQEGTEQEAATEQLVPDGVTDFDPQGDGNGEHGDKASLAMDGDPSTAWKTSTYQGPQFGKLKPGVGLVFDMGGSVELHEADLVLGEGSGGHSVEVRVGDNASLDAMPVAGAAESATGETTVELEDPAKGRYVLVWFTDLPASGGGYQGSINEVTLHGTT